MAGNTTLSGCLCCVEVLEGEGRRGEPLPARHPLIDSGIKVVPCDEWIFRYNPITVHRKTNDWMRTRWAGPPRARHIGPAETLNHKIIELNFIWPYMVEYLERRGWKWYLDTLSFLSILNPWRKRKRQGRRERRSQESFRKTFRGHALKRTW